MADGNPPQSSQPPVNLNTAELIARFEQLLRIRRLNTLAAAHAQSRPPNTSPLPSHPAAPTSPLPPHHPLQQDGSTVPPAYASLHNAPRIATPPRDLASLRFRNQLISHSVGPTRYENPGLLDEALAICPLDSIYDEAEDENQLLQAQARSMGENVQPEWGYQDCVIKALMR